MMWLLWLTFIDLSICNASKYNEHTSVDSKTTVSFTTQNNGDILYDLWFMYYQRYSFQHQRDGQIDLNLDIETASMTLVDSSLPQQGVTLIGKQYNSSIETKLNLLCPSDTNVAVSTNHVFNAYKLHSEHEIDLFTPLACPTECISYNDQTKEYQQCNGRGICSFDPFILQTHCLCETGYNSSSQCGTSSTSSRRRLAELPHRCREIIFDQHTIFRRDVARGAYEYDSVSRTGGDTIRMKLPAAAAGAMKDLRWDDELATQASEWADKLKAYAAETGALPPGGRKHSTFHIGEASFGYYQPSARLKPYGENILEGRLGESVERTSTETRTWWEDETSWYKWGTHYQSEQAASGMSIGHLTQAMWGNTERIGCGYSEITGHIFIVCQYFPSGNHQLQIPYRTQVRYDEAAQILKPTVSKTVKAKAKAKKTKTALRAVSAETRAKVEAKKTKRVPTKTDMEIISFIEFLKYYPKELKFDNKVMRESQFVKYCQENGYREAFTEAQLQLLFKSHPKFRTATSKIKMIRVTKGSTGDDWEYFRSLRAGQVKRLFFGTDTAVQAYDNYYNDNSFYEDERVDTLFSDNIYRFNPYFNAQFVAFNFIQITLQILILSLLFCACAGIILFFISKWSKKIKANHYIHHDAVDQV